MKRKKLTFLIGKPQQLSLALSLLKDAALRLQSKNTTQWSFWIDPPQDKVDWIKRGFEKEEFRFVYFEKELVGMFRLMFFDEEYWGNRADRHDKAAYVHSLTVKSSKKGKGFGRQILEMIEQELLQQNIKKFRLDCMKDNQALCEYYESCGFQKVGEVQMSWAAQNLYEKKLSE